METRDFSISQIPRIAFRVLTSPTTFFKEMPKQGDFFEPLMFMIAMGVIKGTIDAAIGLIMNFSTPADALWQLASILKAPIGMTIGGFILAAIFFIIWKLLGSKEPYMVAFRCTAYLSALSPIAAIITLLPYVGIAIQLLAMTLLLIVASVKVHNLGVKKASAVFGIICALLLFSSIKGEYMERESIKNKNNIQKKSMVNRSIAMVMNEQIENNT